ncbi:hypothetical protein Pan44_46960 [Caulifigura coniformis]|uniref:SLBB domain protein n=1 Tax=Caulifigura coniformis TaxID=2527983 RepID=A0A517SKI2_9PLAN|nr:hypothetical protein [Caulifigura coniformis]QDT56639.1 hypothetical protein Pan44_46960 [Caulifigura coniformis]
MSVLRQGLLIVACCLTAVAATASFAVAQSGAPRYLGSDATVVEFGEHRAFRTRRIAVVGDVERPGVYESTTRQVSAAEVLAAAGSRLMLGDYFSRHNGGLPPVSISTSTADSQDVVTGDVLVVAVPPTRRKPPAATEDIHVAAIGLAPEPVVIRVGPSERSLATLFFRLNQPSEAAVAARVNGAPASGPLKNGDVIVVGSNLVDRRALLGCHAILTVRPLAAELPQVAPTTESAPPVAAAEVPLLPVLEAPAPESRPPATIADSPVEPAPAPEERRVALLTDSPSPTAPEDGPQLVHEEERPAFRRFTARPAFGRRSAVKNAAWETPDVSGSESNVRGLVILLALGTLGLGVTLLWLTSERRLRTAAAREPVPVIVSTLPELDEPVVEEVDRLEELLHGGVSIEDEPVVLPSRISLHGEAVGQKRLIVHPPQALAGPHFGAASTAAAKVESKAEPAPRETAPVTSRPPASPIRSAKDTEGLLDRVLLAMQREERR